MKGRMDKVEGGKVRFGGGIIATEVSTSEGMRIAADGTLATAASTGAHVREWSINKDGARCSVTFYKPNATGSLCVAYYTANGALISGIASGTGSGRGQINTETVSLPTGTRTVRVFSIRSGSASAEAALTVLNTGGVYNMVEIKVRRPGTNFSQVVWPTVTTYRITNARLVYSGNTVLAANGGDYAMAYGDIEATLGTQTTITRNVVLTPLRITPNDHLVIDGVDQQIYYISGNRVLAKDLKTAYAPYGTATNVIFGYMGQEVSLYVQQHPNVVVSSGFTNKSYTGYRIELNNTDFTPSGGTATVTGYAQFTARPYESWTSGAVTYGSTVSSEEEQTPGSISVSPSGATISGTTITFPANTGSSEKVYTVTGRWSSYTATEYAYVYGTDTGKTYTDLRITSFDYPNSRIIPASGGSMYPTVAISIKCNGTTMTGSVSDGSTVCEVSGGSYTATVNLAYSGAPNGFVSANSLGTNETSSATLLASVSVTATKGSLSATSATRNVSQERNVKSVYSQGTYAITSMSVTPKIGSTAISGAIPAKSATVTLEILVSGSGTTTRYRYTSGAYSGGDTVTDTDKPLSQADLASLSVTSGGSAVTVSNLEFTASNQHNLTAKTYSISANYEGTTRTASVQQAADAKKDGSATPHISLSLSSNNLTAGGGYVDVIATAYSTAGKVWASDGTPVSGESSKTDNTSSVLLDITQSSQGAFPSVTPIATDTTNHTKTFRISHRDMTNNITTDTISVTARNGSAQSSALSYSVSNELENTEYEEEGEVVWGGSYPIASNYKATLTLDNYNSQSAPAPFYGGTTSYTASAYHDVSYYHDGTVPINTYRRYTSWSAEKDDSSHKELVSTTYDTSRYRGVLITGSTRRIPDGLSLSGPSWVGIDASAKVITIYAQGDNDARADDIVATNTTDPNHATASRTIYQAAYASLEAIVEAFIFEPGGGNGRFDISWIRTGWNVTHSGSGGKDPITFISPISGGSASGRNTETIAFTVGANSESVPIFAEIAITPTTEGLDAVYVDVMVKTSATPPVYHDYEGYANCVWLNDYRFEYNAIIQNNTTAARTLYDIYLLIASTDSESVNPDSHGQLERRIRLDAITTSESDSIVVRGEYSMNRESGKYYWAKLEGVYSEYMPFEYEIEEE